MNPASSKPVSAQVLDAAIAWQLSLDSGDGDLVAREAFSQWLASDEEHARAWRQLGLLDQRVSMTSGPARAALLQSREGIRRQVRKLGSGVASIVAVIGLALFVGDRYLPLDYWLADQRTATGEQRTLRLSDGTLVNLNTHSAMDVRFDEKQRLIILQEGEILVETGHGDARPFIVETREGSMRALGTRFLVKREEEGTRLSVLQSAVAAHPESSAEEQILREGQQVLMRNNGLGPIIALNLGADAWTRGMLVVDNVRLEDLVHELGRYRRGYVGVAPQVADLRITGSFPLHDTDQALNALLPTLPVQIEQHTQWWVTVASELAPARLRSRRKITRTRPVGKMRGLLRAPAGASSLGTTMQTDLLNRNYFHPALSLFDFRSALRQLRSIPFQEPLYVPFARHLVAPQFAGGCHRPLHPFGQQPTGRR